MAQPEIPPELAKGVWNDRTAKKISAELTQIRQLVPPAQQQLTDWNYLQQLQASRLPVNRQQARAITLESILTGLKHTDNVIDIAMLVYSQTLSRYSFPKVGLNVIVLVNVKLVGLRVVQVITADTKFPLNNGLQMLP